MRKKIFRYSALISLFMVLLSVVLVLGIVYLKYDDFVKAELRQEGILAAKGLENGQEAYLESIYHTNSRVTWIAADGTVLFDNKADSETMDNHLGREEIRQALSTGYGSSSRYSGTLSEKTSYFAVRMSDGSVLRISTTFPSIFSMLYQLLLPLLSVAGLLIIMTGILSHRMASEAVAPINNVDLEHLEQAEVYEELGPFLARIACQNRKIEEQMEELKRRQQEFKTITENMSEGFLLVDSRTNILAFNGSAKRLLNMDDSVEYETALAVNRSGAFRQVMEKALEGRHNEQIYSTDGRYYQLLANPVRQEEKIVGAVIMIMDVTERMAQENMRREFTANVSHELKTPLTSISGFAEIIAGGIVKDEDIPRFAGKIYEESKRLLGLVNDILRLSRLDENSELPEKEAVDLYQLSVDITERLRPAAEKMAVTLKVEGESTVIIGIRQILDEIIYNLSDNAIKYNKKGGRVTISVKRKAGCARVKVTDTGIGIPYKHQARVFERFYRVDKSHSREIGGTGLGLSIVKHGVLLHNAEISLESQVGKGTVVSVTFPAEANQISRK